MGFLKFIDGPHQRETGSLVLLLTIEQSPSWWLSLKNSDIELRQSQLYFIASDS
jgi:hypothetical protein